MAVLNFCLTSSCKSFTQEAIICAPKGVLVVEGSALFSEKVTFVLSVKPKLFLFKKTLYQQKDRCS